MTNAHVRITFLTLLSAILLITLLHTRFLATLYALRDPLPIPLILSAHSLPLRNHSLPTPSPPPVPSPTVTPPPAARTRPTLCIIYDSPPHTPSTIPVLLSACLRSRVVANVSHELPPTQIVHNLTSVFNSTVLFSSAPLFLSISSVLALRAHCRHLLYITATASMHHRLWHAARLRAQEHPLDWLVHHGHNLKRYYDHYPFLTPTSPISQNPPFLHLSRFLENPDARLALSPDFVVRADHLSQDLSQLLHALRCNRVVQPPVVSRTRRHSDCVEPHVRERVLTEIVEADGGDSLASSLSQHADKHNAHGLRRISNLLNSTLH